MHFRKYGPEAGIVAPQDNSPPASSGIPFGCSIVSQLLHFCPPLPPFILTYVLRKQRKDHVLGSLCSHGKHKIIPCSDSWLCMKNSASCKHLESEPVECKMFLSLLSVNPPLKLKTNLKTMKIFSLEAEKNNWS